MVLSGPFGKGALGSSGQLHEERIVLSEKTEIGRGDGFRYLHNDSLNCTAAR